MSSLSFAGIDLGQYGVTLRSDTRRSIVPPPRLRHTTVTGRHGAYSFEGQYEPREFMCDLLIEGLSLSDLHVKLDYIAEILNIERGVQPFAIDAQPDRYWLAQLARNPEYIYQGRLATTQAPFICTDPFAYGVDAIEHIHTIDSSPQTVYESLLGNTYCEPVWTFVPSVALSDDEVVIAVGTTADELTWEGSAGTDESLVIDSSLWHVTVEGTASMNISGSFPRLLGGVTNAITITGFTGSLTITYRPRYL